MKTHQTLKIKEKRIITRFLSVQRGLLVFAFLVFLISGPQAAFSTSDSYDVLIKGGTIYDGTLKPPYLADIGIKNDKIAAIGILSGEANKTLDASGFIITPGFIDIHEHSDMLFDMIASGEGFDFTPAMKENLKGNFNALYQGVTTVVTGNCGNGISDTEKWFAMIESMNFGTNVMHLVPHGKLRQELFGTENQPGELNSEQLRQLKARVEEEMKKGACGISTGLAYSPGIAARTEELIELAKVVGKYGGIYATHMRDESGMVLEDGRIALLESIREAIEIGRRAGVPVQISHLKLSAPYTGVKASEILGLIEEGRREGLDITADSYPYTAGFTEISILLPARFKRPEGGIADQYKTKQGREEIKDFIQAIFTDIPPERIKIMLADEPTYQGKTLKKIAALEGKDPTESTYEKPNTYAEGIVHLLVNGVVTIENRNLTGRRGGRALKGRGKTKNK